MPQITCLIKSLVDNTDQSSYASRMRQKRFNLFLNMLESLPKPVKILDVGGTQTFWEVMGFTDVPDVKVTLLNLQETEVDREGFVSLVGDVTNLSEVRDNQFDVVFSNSVIEHVGDYSHQKRMAQEVRRVGKRYFVQTPNYFFPIEPHFLFIGFQWLPLSVRVFLITYFRLGWMERVSDPIEAREVVEGIRLLRKKELLALFPGATLYEEKLLGMTKSLIVYDGWQRSVALETHA